MKTQQPTLSIIVVVHNMPEQALNTLYSLCAQYQMGVSPEDYEVWVMENDSGNNLDQVAVSQLGPNFHYLLRQDSGVSPAPAINQALNCCHGEHVGLLIDGARMLTPRVVQSALALLALPGAVVAVPGYYLTEAGMGMPGQAETQPEAILAHEEHILAHNAWREDGYQLFRHARFSNGNRHGYMEPWMECNALFCSRSLLTALGGANEQFNLVGGGAINLHLYRQVATSPNTQLFVLPGEGNFHQFHGGTTTITGAERDARVSGFKAQLDSYWPGGFKGIRREPKLYGTVGAMALPFLTTSAQSAAHRLDRFKRDNRNPWEDEQRNGHST